MPSLAVSDAALEHISADALVIGLVKAADGPVLAPGAEGLEETLHGRLLPALVALGATGAAGEVTKLATLGAAKVEVIAAVGLGEADSDGHFRVESVRHAAGAAVRELAGRGSVTSTLGLVNGDDPATLRAAGEGAALGAYEFTRYRTVSAEGRKPPVAAVTLAVRSAAAANGSDTAAGPAPGSEAAEAAVVRSATLAAAVGLARDLVNTAPNDLHPVELAAAAQEAAGRAGVDVEVLGDDQLAAGGFGGILAVGAGSANPPRLVHLTYRGPGATVTLALVGKGITFDSGGISLKPSANMHEMKSDMAGAAAVIAAVCAAADLRLGLNVEAWVPMAENLPGGSAYRPGDVVTMYGGRNVEVLNTDAEGRMILADAIARAVQDSPQYLVETSTLTGAQVVALGHRVSGVMGDEALGRRIVEAGERSGEPMWAMPLPEEVRRGLDSPFADISQVNASGDRGAGMLAAGHFLAEFVPDGVPFAHIDVAGPSYNSGRPHGYTTVGGTGVPVRTLVELMEDISASG